MRKIICAPENLIPEKLNKGTIYFSTYPNTKRKNVGSFGSTLREDIIKAGLRPSETVWDFNTIALSVAATDKAINRSTSADGWTRQLDLTIHLSNPEPWFSVKELLEKTLRFLTGDFWYLTFKDGGITPPYAKKLKYYKEDCIALLSGGVDSLVGAIDLIANNQSPLFVSQVVSGNGEAQRNFAQIIRSKSTHFMWNHNINLPTEETEGSTRSRSIVFLAFGALAVSAIENIVGSPAKIYLAENGFISLNLPLNLGRIGSFSTKTTHPVYLQGMQNIWDNLGIKIQLITPYCFKTKGEMLAGCKNKNILITLIDDSTSCGKYRRNGLQHCGSCVPCLVRRAAYTKAKIKDNTIKGYKYQNLSIAGRNKGPNDLGAMVGACLRIKKFGIRSLITGNLSFSDHKERKDYEAVIKRGFKEVEAFLKDQGVI